jgi:hypothetical protein
MFLPEAFEKEGREDMYIWTGQTHTADRMEIVLKIQEDRETVISDDDEGGRSRD